VTLPHALDVAIPLVVLFLMWLVGLRVTLDDFRLVLERLRLTVATLLSQVLVAVDSLGRPEVAGFASAFALVQIPLLLLVSLALRRLARSTAPASS